MKSIRILALLLAGVSALAQAQSSPRDEVIQEMHQAFRADDRKRLSELLPRARGHALEPWAAYWELRARLDTALPEEVRAFLVRHAGTYQEDRLRNDWLLLAGQRRDWDSFAEFHPQFRMNDDREVRCYAAVLQLLREGDAAPSALAEQVRRDWFALRDADDGCTLAASRFIGEGRGAPRMTAADAWRKARLAMEANRPRAVAAAVELVAPEAMHLLSQVHGNPSRFLARMAPAVPKVRIELVGLALIRLAASDVEAAARLMRERWGLRMAPEERDWVWAVIGKWATLRLQDDALEHFNHVRRASHLSDDLLAWNVRAALRAPRGPDWARVRTAIEAMSEDARSDPAWTYWRARALRDGRPLHASDAERAEAQVMAQALFDAIASPRGFYEQLALEETGRLITVPARPAPLTAVERDAAARNPGLQRALHALRLGLRSEGVREWNYTTNMHTPGGMNERELLAAAQLACDHEVWDRCINTSERTREAFDAVQRYPMPFRDAVVRRTREIGLEAAYVYGLIRQESRFIMDARSHAGASGLMQVMPATARWTARRIGLDNFKLSQLNDRDINIAIGTGYLKLVLDDFDGSMPLAAAAYNAGPGRPRNWRNGPIVEPAIWAESVPFTETREYVKKVLANTTFYAAVLTGEPQSLKARLGHLIGPRDASLPAQNRDLP